MPLNSISLDSYGFGNEISTSACKFKKYDFLFGSIRPYFKKAGICPFSGISNTSVFILRVHKIFDREFLYFYCSSDNIFKKSVQFSDGTKMPIIKWNDFKEFKFALPNEELRNYFSVKINHIIERIIKNNEEQEILKKLRDMLAPKLIYGELKL
jgi:type I restriction enzyme S subunit